MAASPPELLIVLGTRPEIIKLAPVIRALEAQDLPFRILHTDQHYDEELSGVFFENLDLPRPDASLDIGSGSQGEQTAAGIEGIEREIQRTEPVAVLALGDTNAVLSAALATSKTDAEFVHLEAGIRSFDREMPEEVNRVVADQLADVAFAPTETAVDNLAAEGITDGVHMVGNTIVDACHDHADLAAETSTVHDQFGLTPGEYAVATIHRPRNTDDADRLETVVRELNDQPFPVIFPAHPRTTSPLDALAVNLDGSLIITDPLDYLDFLALLDAARVVVTDSGGIQEEASILEVPCLTVRPNTERPETVEVGVNELVTPEALQQRLATLLTDQQERAEMTGYPNLYGDGSSGEKIVSILSNRYRE